MSIFTRFTCRSLAKNRTRTVVSVIGVALSCALICAVLTSAVSLANVLIQRTAADEGWWYAEAAGIDAEDLAQLKGDDRVTDLLALAELGSVSLGDENSSLFGTYLYAKTWPDTRGEEEPLVSTPEIVEGHAPEAPGEVILPHYLQSVELAPCGITTADGNPVAVGSTVELALGTHTATSKEDGVTNVVTSIRGDYINESTHAEAFDADLGTITATVVGFYRSYGYSSLYSLQGNSAFIYDDGSAAERAMADTSDATWASAVFRTADPADAEPIADEIIDVHHRSVDGASSAHTSLIRWMGVTPDAAIWNTLYQISGILAVVVVVAGVSLVYNSFAISVSERTRQFGLLSSLGASKRQLRRTVLAEALIIGGIGIPAGLALGLVGCFVVFGALGEGIAALAGGAAAGVETAGVVVNPVALAIAALLGLVTLLVSAWIPAVRASRVSAVDAIRHVRDVRLTGRARRRMRRNPAHASTGDAQARSIGLAGKIFGIPGFIAHRNLTRASSKGRVTVGALAVSVALLIVSGSLADVMTYASDTSVDAMQGQDLLLSIDATGAGADQTLALDDGKVNGPGMQDALARLHADASELEKAEAIGYTTIYIADALFPASMANEDIEHLENLKARLQDGSWYGSTYVEFIDDASWQAYIDELGLSRAAFCDPAHPRAVLVNAYNVSTTERYSRRQPFDDAGTIESLEFKDLDGRFVSDIRDGADGALEGVVLDDVGNEQTLAFDEVVERGTEIEVGALADHAPACVVEVGYPHVILPASAIRLADTMGYIRAIASFDTGGDATLATDAQEAIEKLARDYPELDITYTNVARDNLQARLMATTVNTFIYCFAAITGIIAVANVFNTLANALMLRRREFAMLKSIGMDSRAFRRMIAYECASYALRGFTAGLVLAACATYGLFQAMMLSYSTYEFTLPWVQIGMSAVVVVGVIVASVVYALHRCRTSSVVEALRTE